MFLQCIQSFHFWHILNDPKCVFWGSMMWSFFVPFFLYLHSVTTFKPIRLVEQDKYSIRRRRAGGEPNWDTWDDKWTRPTTRPLCDSRQATSSKAQERLDWLLDRNVDRLVGKNGEGPENDWGFLIFMARGFTDGGAIFQELRFRFVPAEAFLFESNEVYEFIPHIHHLL